ncbi:Uncharacterized RNA methyltransferase pc1998 [Linum grandiflorum]
MELLQIIFGNRWRHLLGERDFWEHAPLHVIYFHLLTMGFAFSQAFESLLRKLHKYVPQGATVADLYAGAGVIGLSVAANRKCRQVTTSGCSCHFRLLFSSQIKLNFLVFSFPDLSSALRLTKNQSYPLRRQLNVFQSL